MKTIAPILICILLASCAGIPKAVVVPPVVKVTPIKTAGVEEASKRTRAAVRDVADAGSKVRLSADKLQAEIEALAKSALVNANLELREAVATLQTYAKDLADALALAEQKEKIALEVIDDQEEVISELKAHTLHQASQLEAAAQTDAVLREQVVLGQQARDKLIIADKKASDLKRHRLWLVIACSLLILWIVRKPLLRLLTGIPI